MMDQCKIFAKAGDGGNGCSSLRKGRPDGVFSLLIFVLMYSQVLNCRCSCVVITEIAVQFNRSCGCN